MSDQYLDNLLDPTLEWIGGTEKLAAAYAKKLGTTGTPVAVNGSAPSGAGQVLVTTSTTAATWQTLPSYGDASGPGSSANNEVAAFSGTGGKTLKNTGILYTNLIVEGDSRLTNARTPTAHHASHENGGADEISVSGLSGVLADPQIPNTHHTYHENGGSDEISVSGLSGVLADPQVANKLNTSGSPVVISSTAPTAGQVLTASSATAASWETPAGGGGGGSGTITGPGTTLTGAIPTWGGTDGTTLVDSGVLVSQLVQTTDGRLSNARTPLQHSSDHKHGGTDEVGTASPGPNAILKATSSGTIASGWIPYGTSSTTVCVGNDSRLTNDRVASGIRTASGVVVTSAAAAPSAGQVLTALNATSASWQTPSGGGGSTSGAAVVTTDSYEVPGATLADVPNVSIPLSASTAYGIGGILSLTQTTATGVVGVALKYTGTVNSFLVKSDLNNSVTAESTQMTNASGGTALVDSSARNTGGPFATTLEGIISTATSGNLQLMVQRSAGTTTLNQGSGFWVRPLASLTGVATGGGGSGGGGGGGGGGGASGPMKIGTNFWFISGQSGWWTGEQPMINGVNWTTAYGSPSGAGSLASTNIWNPTWSNELTPYSALRFMDWQATNGTPIVTWASRRTATDNNYESWGEGTFNQTPAGNNRPLALEWLIDACNRFDKDLWLNFPVKANDDYFAQAASMVLAKLKPTLKVYLEFSNENWNGAFPAFNYSIAQGAAMPSNFTSLFGDQWRRAQGWCVWRSIKIWEAFENAFGGDFATRCKRVYAYSGDYNIGTSAMSIIFNNATYNPNDHKPDCIAIAPYFGGELNGATATQSQMRASINDTLNTRFSEPLADCATYDADLVCYEAGQSIYSNNSATIQGASWWFDEYTYYLDQLAAKGCKLVMHYTHTGRWSGSDGWGAKASTGQALASAPKYNALLTWAGNH